MKREINCDACASAWAEIITPNAGPDRNGEALKQVAGKSALNCMCDGCGAHIGVGEPATATSLYSKQDPYFEWEDGYLDDPGAKPRTED